MDALKDIIENKDNDRELASQDPLKVIVAGHPIYVRCFTYKNYERWLSLLGTMLLGFHRILSTFDFPETEEQVVDARRRFMALMSIEKMQQSVFKMIRQTVLREPYNSYWRRRWRKFKRHVTFQQVIDLFFYIYLFNHEAVKKNVSFLLKRVGFVRSLDTYTSSSTKNLGGIVSKSIGPRFANSPFTSNGGPKVTSPWETVPKRQGQKGAGVKSNGKG